MATISGKAVGSGHSLQVSQANDAAGAASLWDAVLKGFGLVHDPFSVDYILTHQNLLTAQTRRTISHLAERIRFAAESNTNVLLVGPEGSGRTLLLRSLASGLAHGGMDGSVTYFDAIRGRLGDVHPEASSAHQPRHLDNSAKKGLGRSKGLVLIDNADRIVDQIHRRLEDLAPEEGGHPVLVLSISYATYTHVLETKELSRRFRVHLLVPLRERSEIAQILRASVGSCSSGSDPFELDAYEAISTKAMGLPGLAKDLARSCLQAADWVETTRVTGAFVDRIAEYLPYNRANRLLSQGIRFRDTRVDVAHEVLRRLYMDGVARRNDLARALGRLSGSKLDYELRELEKQEVLTSERYGYRVRYVIHTAVRAALQIIDAHDITSGRGEATEKRSGVAWLPRSPYV